MATKTITIDLEAYKRLKESKKENESFSQVIKRKIMPPVDLDAWLKKLRDNPMGDQAAEAIEEQVSGRLRRSREALLMALLDTTVYVDLRGRRGGARKTEADAVIRHLSAAGESFVTSRLNLGEMYIGVELGNDSAGETKGIEDFLSWVSVLEFDDRAARFYARIRADLQRRGRLIGDIDILIGGIALANGHTVVTRNAAHFKQIPGLTVVGYGAR